MPQRQLSESLNLEELIGFKIAQLSLRIATSMSRSYSRRFNIGTPEYRIILILGHRGAQSLVELANFTGMDAGIASRTVDGLVTKGLLTKRSHPDDRRRRTVVTHLFVSATKHQLTAQQEPRWRRAASGWHW